MLAKIREALSPKPVTQESFLRALNVEVIPILRKVRDALNSAIGDEYHFSLVNQILLPTLGTDVVGREVDAGTMVFTGILFNPDDYQEESFGRVRRIYFRVIGKMYGASTSVAWQLYDGTAGSVVADALFSTSSILPEDSGLVGPLDLLSGDHEYVVLAARQDGVAEAHLMTAELVVRYE